MAKKYLYNLYLSGQFADNKRICENLRSILDEKLKDQYSLDIIDVTEDPTSVLKANIFSTPTLVRQRPSPLRVVMGDLSDREKLAVAVEISLK